MKYWLPGILGATLLAVAAAAVTLAWYDGDRIRASIEASLADKHGVTLRIESLTRSYEFRPLVQIEGLSVANAQRRDETLIAIDSARFRVRLDSLLFGPLTLDDLQVDGARVAIPVDRAGVRYWEPVVDAISSFLHRFDFSLHGFRIGDLTLDRQHFEHGSELLVSAEDISGTMPELAGLRIAARGVDANLETTLPLRLEGTARLDELTLGPGDGELPISLTARGHVGEKKLVVDVRGGNLLAGDPLERDAVEGHIEVAGRTARISGTMSRDDDLHIDVEAVVAVPSDNSEDMLRGRLRLSDPGEGWRFSDIRVGQGDASLSGDVSIMREGERRHVDVQLDLDQLHYPLDDEAADAPDDNATDDATHEPTDDLYAGLLDFIERFDAKIAVDIDGSTLYGAQLDDLNTLTTVNRGTFEFRVDRGELLGGELLGTLTVVQETGSAALTLDASLQQADLAALLAGLPAMDGSAGAFDGDVALSARGRETSAMLSSIAGEFSLFLPGGEMPDELAKWMGGDVLAAIFTDFDGTTTPVDCAVIEFDVADGIARSRRMVLDTGSFTLVGDGRIDFPEGYLAIEVAPSSKRFRLLAMRLPVTIEGPYDDIRVDPDASDALVSLLTPIDTGAGADAGCTPPEARVAAR